MARKTPPGNPAKGTAPGTAMVVTSRAKALGNAPGGDAPEDMLPPEGPIDVNLIPQPPDKIVPGDIFTSEVGYKGLLQTGGFVFEEFRAELRGWQGARKLQEMADNDAVMAGMIYAVAMMIQQIEWTLEPADKSDAATKAAERVKDALFEDMDESWSQLLGELMYTTPTHGYSIFEIIWKVCKGKTGDKRTNSIYKDNAIMPRRLAPRSPLTIYRWEFDRDGDVAGVWQSLANMNVLQMPEPLSFQGDASGMVYIPAVKYLNFKWNATRGNPEGRPMIRGCYINYLRKKTLEDAEGRLAVRSAGILVLRAPARYMDPNADPKTKAAYQAIVNAAMRIAQDRSGAMTLPSDTFPRVTGDVSAVSQFNIEFVTADRRTTQDTGLIIERLDSSNAMTMLADFMLLGHGRSSSGGSHAQNSSKTDTFMTALGAIAQSIADEINRGLIAKIWDYNGWPDETKPTLKPGEITPPDLGKLGTLILNLAQAGFEMAPDTVLQNAIRHAAHLPEVQDDGIADLAAQAAARQKLQNMVQMPGEPQPGGDAPLVPGVAGKNGPAPTPGQGGPPALGGKPANGKPAPAGGKPGGQQGGSKPPPSNPAAPPPGISPAFAQPKPKIKPSPEMLAAIRGAKK